MLTFKVDDETLKAFGRRFSTAKQKQVRIALGDIRREWHTALTRQQVEFQGKWPALTEKYAKRKARDFASGRHPEVKYLDKLRRTGTMMDKYLRGIRIDETNLRVVMPFPRASSGLGKTLNTRAKVHQGVWKMTKGTHPPRPFDTEEFKQIALAILKRAITSDPKQGAYKGFNR